jgi:hypothetical protein
MQQATSTAMWASYCSLLGRRTSFMSLLLLPSGAQGILHEPPIAPFWSAGHPSWASYCSLLGRRASFICRFTSVAMLLSYSRWDPLHADQLAARPLSARGNIVTEQTQTSMPSLGFKPTIPVLERPTTFHTLDLAATVTVCAEIMLWLTVCWCGVSSLTRGRVCWASSAQAFSDPSPAGLMTILCRLKCETPSLCRPRSRIFSLRKQGSPFAPPGNGLKADICILKFVPHSRHTLSPYQRPAS